MALTLPKDSRLYAAYRASLRLWLTFTHRSDLEGRYEHADNLCHLVRTLAIYGPCVILSQLAAWGWVAFCLYLPVTWFGWGPYLWRVLIVVGGGAAAVGTAVLLIASVLRLIDRWKARARAVTAGEVKPFPLRRLAKAYMQSRLHQKLCPIVSFASRERTHA